MSDSLPPLPAPEHLREAATALRERAKALVGLAKAIEGGQPNAIGAAHARVETAPLPEDATAGVGTWLGHERDGRRRRLAQELRAGCDARGISARVLERAPLRLRLRPFSLDVDVDADTAELGFGRAPLVRVRADAQAVLTAHEMTLATLQQQPLPKLHRDLRAAWSHAGGTTHSAWAPLARVWSALAWLRQPDAFHRDPTGSRMVAFSRAAFLFELHRLRAGAALSQDGWRLGLGTAAAGSMKDRSAVFWVEDAEGNGQWHHTLRFTPES